MPNTTPTTNYQQVAKAVLRFTPQQQARLASRIQKNLSLLVEQASQQVQRRVANAALPLTEDDIAREVEAVRVERYARR